MKHEVERRKTVANNKNFFFRPYLDKNEKFESPIPETKFNSPDIITFGDTPIDKFTDDLIKRYSEDLTKLIALKQGYDNYIYVRGMNHLDPPVTKRVHLYYVPNKLKNWPYCWKPLKTANGSEYVTVSFDKNKEIGVGDDCFIWENVPPLPEGSDSYCLIAQAVNVDSTTGKNTSNGTCASNTEHKPESNNQEHGEPEQGTTDSTLIKERYGAKPSYLNLYNQLQQENIDLGLSIMKPVKQDIPDLQLRKCLYHGKKKQVRIIINCENLNGSSVSLACNTNENATLPIYLSKQTIDQDNMVVGLTTTLEDNFSGTIVCNFWQGKAKDTPDGAYFSMDVVECKPAENQDSCSTAAVSQENTKGVKEAESSIMSGGA